VSRPLIITKLRIPQARTTRELRPHPVVHSRQGLAHLLTLVPAPAGFGKTALLCEWLESCGKPTAWVSLDTGDHDPAHFCPYVIAALQPVYPTTGHSLPNILTVSNPPPFITTLAEWINELTEQPQALILILDDDHVIESQAYANIEAGGVHLPQLVL
jgi:LuxR family transcriptional regulator, maltose regulon positive regulatory protein